MDAALNPRTSVLADKDLKLDTFDCHSTATSAIYESKCLISLIGGLVSDEHCLDGQIQPENLAAVCSMLIRHLNTAEQCVDQLWHQCNEVVTPG